MKYYIRLFKNKAYRLLFAMFLLVLLGVFVVTIPLNSVIMGDGVVYPYGALKIFEVICFLLGFFILHAALVSIPVSAKAAQDLSEFKVTSDEAYIYIEFRKYKWKIKRENFNSGGSLLFFDEYRHFITMTRGNQVYNAIVGSKETKLDVQCLEKDRIVLIPDAQELSPQEKHAFCMRLKLNKNRWFYKICSMIYFIMGVACFSMPFQVEEKTVGNIFAGIIIGAALGILFIYVGRICFSISCEGKKEYKYLKNQDVFKVQVYVYDKLIDGSKHHNRYVKISDGKELFFEELYEVTTKLYDNAANVKWYAYYYREHNGGYKIRVMAC